MFTQGPTAEEIRSWQRRFGLDPRELLSTRSRRYRELYGDGDPPEEGSISDLPELLASEPRMLKRPLLVYEHGVLIGFREQEYEQKLSAAAG